MPPLSKLLGGGPPGPPMIDAPACVAFFCFHNDMYFATKWWWCSFYWTNVKVSRRLLTALQIALIYDDQKQQQSMSKLASTRRHCNICITWLQSISRVSTFQQRDNFTGPCDWSLSACGQRRPIGYQSLRSYTLLAGAGTQQQIDFMVHIESHLES